MRALTELKKQCFIEIGRTDCLCCGESRPKRLLVHHLSYSKESITYDKFPKDDYGRLKYYSNLFDEIFYDRDNFTVLCVNCHNQLEKLLKLTFEDVLNMAQLGKINESIIYAYNKTRWKRGMKILENPKQIYHNPKFLHRAYNNNIKMLFDFIESKEMSLEELAISSVLIEDIENYIPPYPDCVVAATQLETIRTVKKGDEIKFVKILNKPFVKPIELVKVVEIDSKYYCDLLTKFIVNNEILTEHELNIKLGKPNINGLDEFFWS